MPSTKKISAYRHHEFDGHKHRIGLIALDGDIATEADFHAMLPENVMFYTTRIRHINPITVDNLKKLGPQLTEATEKLLPKQRLDVIAYSCTSGTAAVGFEEVEARIREGGRPGVAVVTPLTAALAGCESLAVGSISLLTPHPDPVNQSTGRIFESHGIEVVGIRSFCLNDDLAVASISPQAIYNAALETDQEGADALFISSTALRAVEVLERIEQALQKPVLSAVQCLFWQSLRLSGYAAPVPGFGRLLTS